MQPMPLRCGVLSLGNARNEEGKKRLFARENGGMNTSFDAPAGYGVAAIWRVCCAANQGQTSGGAFEWPARLGH